jgi:putative transcriptional regulator
MKNNISQLLEKTNKTMYWLAKECDTTYPTIHKLTNNKTESIRFDLLEKICIALDCTPNELLIIERDN